MFFSIHIIWFNFFVQITNDLNIVDEIQNDLKNFKLQFDFIFICVPLGSYKNIIVAFENYIKKLNRKLSCDIMSYWPLVILSF